MVPESNPARRRCSRVESTNSAQRSRPGPPFRHGFLVVGAAAAAALALLTPTPSAATAAEEPAAAGSVTLRIAPTVSTTIAPDATVTLEVEVRNATTEPVSAGALRVVRSDSDIDEPGEVDAWLAQAPEPVVDVAAAELTSIDGTIASEAATAVLAPGESDTVSVTLPPEALDPIDTSPVLGFGAELLVDGRLVATAAEVAANANAPVTGPTSLAVVVPVTVPPTASGLLGADDLATWTSPFGLLSRQLDALVGRPVTIAVDPRIIASIRALGSAAPVSAVAWLERLAGLPNEIFPLAYADADVAAQAQIGMPALLAPTSFTDALDPANFTAEAGGAADPGVPDGDGATSPAPTPTTPATGELPTAEALLAWPYTRTDLAWPADDTVAAGDLAVFGASGLTTSILAPGNVEPGVQWANASSTVDGASAVVADARLTPPLREATEAQSDIEWRAATGRLGAELALIGTSAEPRGTLLATLSRSAGAQSARVSATLDAVTANPLVAAASLTDVVGAPPVARTLIDAPEAQPRLDNVARIIRADESVAAFATMLDDPGELTGPTRRDALALLDVGWIADIPAWEAAVGGWLVAQSRTLDSVSVVPSSLINVVSSETGVPTTILNALPYPVTVIVNVAPSNGRLVVEDQVTVTIAPESRGTATVPVAAGIGNGAVTLSVSLTSPTGVPIGVPVAIPANVQADWEGLGAAIIGIIVVVFFGLGIWRNIRRLRTRRAEAAASGETGESDAADEAAGASEADAAGQTTGAPEADAGTAPPADESAGTEPPPAGADDGRRDG
ncbi:DUF6049 family protein [Agromyces laixinhei]|uniref:DUF6049 family protein n=1 Tax=Agromyces laixinhei TaxID=2585717 RepID=UPI001117747B|nr:DUF6049 family protein [Agromyces laixinhei]